MNRHFSDMLSALNAEGVEYLVVGGYAVGAHGLSRATKDFDIWVRPSSANSQRTLRALVKFGAALQGLTKADLGRKGTIFQIGVEPQRIDVLTSIDGVEFEEAWAARVTSDFGPVRGPVIGLDELLRNKRAAARPQDLVDVSRLEKINRKVMRKRSK